MELAERHIVVTGAASGIGRALALRFAAEGARTVVAADYDLAGAQAVADEIDGLAIQFDAGREESVRALIEQATAANGPIDVFHSNAGIGGPDGFGGDDEWDLIWRVNVMSHVWAARILVPEMAARGEGYLLSTASAAGLLTQISALAYSATKAAAVSIAEWISVLYGDSGVKVSCLCPQGVQTPLLERAMHEPAGAAALRAGGIISTDEVADAVVEGIRDERFLILPHPQVAQFMQFKAAQPDKWISAMRRFVRDNKETTA
jgi:NAD(P)-dependent dehydrogenase (short-subunit alcohol dehydrogenase family)